MAAGGSAALERLYRATDESKQLIEFELEYRREIFRWAAKQIQFEFQSETWEAFWQTAVEHRPVSEVAQSLNRTPGAIYIARSRVMRRLMDKVQDFESSHEFVEDD